MNYRKVFSAFIDEPLEHLKNVAQIFLQLQLNTETATGLQEATVTGLTEHTFSGLAPGVLYTVVLSVDDSRQSHKIRTGWLLWKVQLLLLALFVLSPIDQINLTSSSA